MKIFKAALTVLFVSLMAACSSDDGGTPANNIPSGPEATYFNYKLDGETIPMTVYGGYIAEDEVSVSAGAADGTSIQITFTTYGNLGDVASFSTQDPSFDSRMNFQYAKKNHFDFELLYVANGQAKVNFSGKVYSNEYDLDSEFSMVEGSFLVNLQQVQPVLPGAGVVATVNGNEWHEVEVSQSSGSGGENGTYWSVNFNSDDEYGISFFINPNNLAVGNYTFNSASTANRVVVYKYNPMLGYEEQFVSNSGTFNITSKTVSGPYTIIEGTFTATATHPDTNEVVTITNGSFKTAYDF